MIHSLQIKSLRGPMVAISLLTMFQGMACTHRSFSNIDTSKKIVSVRTEMNELDETIKAAMDRSGLPGLALGVIENGSVVLVKGYGTRIVGEDKPVDGDTVFGIGSITKPMTTAMIARQVQKGRVTWNQTLSSLNPKFSLWNAGHELTLQDAVCNCSGLPPRDAPLFMTYNEPLDRRIYSLADSMQPVQSYSEKQFIYSNTLFTIAGLTSSGPAGSYESYHRAMQDELFIPLGMDRTTSKMSLAWQMDNFAVGHKLADGKLIPTQLEDMKWVEAIAPAGSVFSSINDMMKFLQMEINLGGSFLTPEAVLYRRKPQAKKGNGKYTLGWLRFSGEDIEQLLHDGGTFNYKSFATILTKQRSGVVILTNGQNGNDVRNVAMNKIYSIWFSNDFHLSKAIDRLSVPVPDPKDSYIESGDGMFGVMDVETYPLSAPQIASLEPLVGSHTCSFGKFEIIKAGAQFFLKGRVGGFEIASSKQDGGTKEIVSGENWSLLPRNGSFDLGVPDDRYTYRFEKSANEPT